MFDRLLVPLDGSAAGEAILPAAAGLARASGGEILLATLEEPGPQDPGPGFLEESAEFDEDYLARTAAALEKAGVRTRRVVRGGPVVEGLMALVREERIGLIAMSTHGRTASPQRPFGGVAQQLLRCCPVPVLAAPSLSRPPGMQPAEPRLLVTTDGSEASRAIFPAAADYAACMRAKVDVLRILTPGTSRTEVERDLEAVRRRFEERGLAAEAILETGEPHGAIPEIAHRRRSTTIAMSTRAGPGSVAQAVLREAGVPLLAVRAA